MAYIEFNEVQFKLNTNKYDLIDVKCPHCKRWFGSKRHLLKRAIRSNKRRFCSIECANQFNSTTSVSCSCFRCGKSFLRVTSQLNKSNNLFCGHSCSAKTNNALRPRKTINKSKRIVFNKIEFTCPVCKTQLLVKENHIKKKKFCSGRCRNIHNNKHIIGQRSKIEKEFDLFLQNFYPTVKVITNDRDVLNGMELDFYFPDLKIAIELNGIWHLKPIRGQVFLDKIKNKDQYKISRCKELGINLFVLEDHKSSNKSSAELMIKANEILTASINNLL